MGYLRNHAIIVTGVYGDYIDHAHAKALELFDPETIHVFPKRDTAMVTPILESPVNGTRSFAILPDGSKEGWATSDNGDSARQEFVKYLRSLRFEDEPGNPLDWVEVQYGDDAKRTRLIRSSDHDYKRYERTHGRV